MLNSTVYCLTVRKIGFPFTYRHIRRKNPADRQYLIKVTYLDDHPSQGGTEFQPESPFWAKVLSSIRISDRSHCTKDDNSKFIDVISITLTMLDY